jgi:hypothetical protein
MTLQGVIPEVELFVNNSWTDITTDAKFGVTIDRGYGADATGLRPSTCSFTVDNSTGTYSPRNPLSPYYGTLGRNTPMRVARRLHSDSFDSRTVSSGWGTGDSGDTWSTQISGSGTATDFAVASGKATHLVSAANSGRLSYLGGVSYRDIEVAVTATIPVSNVTGASLGSEIWFRGQAGGQWVARVWVTTAEAVTIAFYGPQTGPSNLIGSTTVAGLTHSSSQPLRIRAQIEGMTLRAKVWQPQLTAEPKDWQLAASDTLTAPAAHAGTGWVGVFSWADTGNTNVPVTVSYDDLVVRSPRFTGEVGSWPVRWDTSGGDPFVRIDAAGVQRRLGQGAAPQTSSLYQAITAQSNTPVAYWPCEDKAGATVIASGLPNGTAMTFTGSPNFGTSSLFVASSPLPQLNQSEWGGLVAPYDNPNGQAQVRFLLAVPSDGDTAATGSTIVRVHTSGTAAIWDLQYTTAGNGSLTLNVYDSSQVLLSTTGAIDFTLKGRLLRVSLEMDQNGANIDWNLSVVEAGASGGGTSGTVTGRTLNLVTGVLVGYNHLFTSTVAGHITVQPLIDSLFTLATQLAGYKGESAGDRIKRVCADTGVPFSSWPGNNSTAMGPQRPAGPLTVIGEAVDANAGLLFEPRGDLALEFRNRVSLCNQQATLALDYATGQLSLAAPPVDDDQRTRNDVTVTRQGGSSARATIDTGPLSTQEPPAGVGRYTESFTLNLNSDSQLVDQAAWRAHLGTVDEARYPEIRVNLARTGLAGQVGDALAVNVGSRITVDNVAAANIYDQISQLVIGYGEEFDSVQHVLTIRCLPEIPYRILTLDDATLGQLDTAGSVIASTAAAGASPLSVATTAGPLWTTDATKLPVDLRVAGERMTLTAVANEALAFVAAGTVAHADNASVTPGLPPGWQAGDVLIGVAAIRNTGAFVDGVTQGYQFLDTNFGHFRLFAKVAGTSETAPTVNFTLGSAGDTTSAQLIALRGNVYNLANLIVDRAYLTNISAQNIAFPGLDLRVANAVVLLAGWKQDDWTSVATLAGFTEALDSPTVTGNDQGLVLDYQIQTAATDIAGGSFVVTGGVSAVSKAIALVLRSDRQSFTVTRGVNGVAKTLTAGTAVELFSRHVLGL